MNTRLRTTCGHFRYRPKICLAMGIPEGVLEPGGQISGFLYFEKRPGSLKRITFEADLANARTGANFGTVRIPFVVK